MNAKSLKNISDYRIMFLAATLVWWTERTCNVIFLEIHVILGTARDP